jgi:DedD protein
VTKNKVKERLTMDSSQDTEITLGTAKLLGLFFGLVIICALFFSLGYTLGRKSEPALITSAATTPLASNAKSPTAPATQSSPAMTFYKAVEQKDANAQLTPVAPDAAAPASAPADKNGTSTDAAGQSTDPKNLPDPTTISASSYFVQVAAVSKQEDADALVDALKQKQYPAFVAANNTTDKLFRVQVGPFNEIKDAEAMRARLINDGYNPILKK